MKIPKQNKTAKVLRVCRRTEPKCHGPQGSLRRDPKQAGLDPFHVLSERAFIPQVLTRKSMRLSCA